MEKVAKKYGARIFTNTPIKKIVTKEGIATGVIL